MGEREELEKAISRLEAERAELGDVAADAALAGLYQKLSELEKSTSRVSTVGSKRDQLGERVHLGAGAKGVYARHAHRLQGHDPHL